MAGEDRYTAGYVPMQFGNIHVLTCISVEGGVFRRNNNKGHSNTPSTYNSRVEIRPCLSRLHTETPLLGLSIYRGRFRQPPNTEANISFFLFPFPFLFFFLFVLFSAVRLGLRLAGHEARDCLLHSRSEVRPALAGCQPNGWAVSRVARECSYTHCECFSPTVP